MNKKNYKIEKEKIMKLMLKMEEKIARLNQMIRNYNSEYGHTLIEIKDRDDTQDMKYDVELVMSILKGQVGQLEEIVDYIEYEIEEG